MRKRCRQRAAVFDPKRLIRPQRCLIEIFLAVVVTINKRRGEVKRRMVKRDRVPKNVNPLTRPVPERENPSKVRVFTLLRNLSAARV